MRLSHLVGHAGHPFVERDVVVARRLEQLEEDGILAAGILDAVAGGARDEADIIGIEVDSPRRRLRGDHFISSLALDPILPFAGIGVPMHLAHCSRLDRHHGRGDPRRHRKVGGIDDPRGAAWRRQRWLHRRHLEGVSALGFEIGTQEPLVVLERAGRVASNI